MAWGSNTKLVNEILGFDITKIETSGFDIKQIPRCKATDLITPYCLVCKSLKTKLNLQAWIPNKLQISHSTLLLHSGTPLHSAAKERKKEAVKFLIENGAFLPDDINDSRFNPPLHYCTGLEWAYEEMKHLQRENLSTGEASYNSES